MSKYHYDHYDRWVYNIEVYSVELSWFLLAWCRIGVAPQQLVTGFSTLPSQGQTSSSSGEALCHWVRYG